MPTMTSRPSLAPQQRSFQRSMTGTGVVQRLPPPNRSLSQQYALSNTAFTALQPNVDLTYDAQARYATSRTGGSRLKQEIIDIPVQTAITGNVGKNNAHPVPPVVEHPRGRPKMNFTPSTTTNPNYLKNNGSGTELSPVPMPARPMCSVQPLVQRKRVQIPAGTVTRKEREGPPKPYVAQVPVEAPRYPPEGHADFFPWMGNQPEDQFSDQIIKQGYYDKTQHSQNETGTAKAAIFPAMKHKTGLQTLSALLVGVLEQRRARGQITSASTFKPPPRVTLTDTKRESWLRDLANPAIALRRLSRTIPHGIRGKVLLDQCLGKNIPTERAVWLAKCVGANEIRSFKRKGATGSFAMGGEAKWIRDWTVFVEQFIESVVNVCGEKEWKARMGYAVRLAAHLYSEHLLDREHYMDWLVGSLDNAGLEKLPVWLLVTQVYWKDLLQFRKYGRRVVLTLLKYLQAVQASPDSDIYSPLLERMNGYMRDILARNTKNLLLPKFWDKYKDTLRLCVGDNAHLNAILDTLDIRNSRLEGMATLNKQSSAQSQLIQLLDSTITQSFPEDLPQRCLRLNASRKSLVQTVLHWSTSPHRPGPTKVYVGARVLRCFVRSGFDVDEAILAYLKLDPSLPKCCKASFYHLISELVRSGHFSIARYIQWLIARGGLRDAAAFEATGPCASRLLAEVPAHNLTDSLDSLRNTLLDRAGFSFEVEATALETAISILQNSLPNMTTEMDTCDETSPDITKFLVGLNRSSRAELGLWLRQTVSEHINDAYSLSSNMGKAMAEPTSSINAYEFNIVRSTLETIQDFSMLADILKITTSSDDTDVLASIADTLDLNLETFAAIGALLDLFDILLVRFRVLAGSNIGTQKVLLASLTRLASRLPDRKLIASKLAQQLVHHDRKIAADVCSPVSDYMAEALQKDAIDFADEIDKVLESGTSMDQPTMERLFQTIVVRLEASFYKFHEQQRSCGILLSKLMTFDPTSFANLSKAWITQYLQLYDRAPLPNVFGHLISLGCISLRDVLSISTATLGKGEASPAAARLALETVVLLMDPIVLLDVMTEEDAYRLRIKQRHFQKDNPTELISALRRAIEYVCLADDSELTAQLNSICCYSQTTSFLQESVLTNTDTVSTEFVQPLAKSTNFKISAYVAEVVRHILTLEIGGNDLKIEQILDLSDDLTMSFCQLQVRLLFTNTSTSDDESRKALIDAFDAAAVTVIAKGNTCWTSIVPCLDVDVVKIFRGRAEDSFMKLLPTRSTNWEHGSGDVALEQALKLVKVLEATAYSIPSTGLPKLAAQVIEKLNDMWAALSTGPQQGGIATKWLPLLLRFITIHHAVFAPDKTGSELRVRVLLSLTSLLTVFLALHSDQTLSSQIFDTALLLVDELPDEARLACIRTLNVNTESRSVANNPLVKYLYGVPTMEFEYLKLECKGKVSDFRCRRWEVLSEPTLRIDGNDTSLSLTLFDARRG